MHLGKLIPWCFFLAVFFLLAGLTLAQEEEEEEEDIVGERPTLQVSELSSNFKLDGILAEPAWGAADSIANLITIEPEEGGVPEGQTVIKVLANE